MVGEDNIPEDIANLIFTLAYETNKYISFHIFLHICHFLKTLRVATSRTVTL